MGKCHGGEVISVGVRIAMQDYKSRHVAAVICATLVNTQTDRQFSNGYILQATKIRCFIK